MYKSKYFTRGQNLNYKWLRLSLRICVTCDHLISIFTVCICNLVGIVYVLNFLNSTNMCIYLRMDWKIINTIKENGNKFTAVVENNFCMGFKIIRLRWCVTYRTIWKRTFNNTNTTTKYREYHCIRCWNDNRIDWNRRCKESEDVIFIIKSWIHFR